MNEAETCRKYVVPRLQDAGWDAEPHSIAEQRYFTDGRKFMWIKRSISPEQRQWVHDLGEPGLLFGPREARLYPNGALAAHVLGGAGYGREGVDAAEVIGTAGVERVYDSRLRDPALVDEPLRLSIDVEIQTATHNHTNGVPIQAVVIRTERELERAQRGAKGERKPRRSDAIAAEDDTAGRKDKEITGVFVVKDGVASKREVALGRRKPGHVQITEGLANGEKVIVEGTQKVRDGIQVVEVESDSGTAVASAT